MKRLVFGLVLTFGALAFSVRADDAPDPHAPQVRAGAQLYTLACAMCHGDRLEGVSGPSLTDASFRAFYAGTTAHGIYNRVRNEMPYDQPGTLTDQEALDVVAFILRENGVTLPQGGVRAQTLDTPLRFAPVRAP